MLICGACNRITSGFCCQGSCSADAINKFICQISLSGRNEASHPGTRDALTQEPSDDELAVQGPMENHEDSLSRGKPEKYLKREPCLADKRDELPWNRRKQLSWVVTRPRYISPPARPIDVGWMDDRTLVWRLNASVAGEALRAHPNSLVCPGTCP